MIAFLASALIFTAVGWCVRNGPYLSSREQEARDGIREGKRRMREAAQAAEALAVARAELEALREETYAKAAQAQAALDEAQARVVLAEQTLRVVQAVREQTVQIMCKRWDEPVAAAAGEPTGVLPEVAHQPVPPDEEPGAEAATAPKLRRKAKVRVDVGGDVREAAVMVP